ncbi:DNA polymerase III subunit beta [Acinetobacter sp. P1(2025)]|uniref:DNA polymerase III subunit beta n=1 Tax=Acinetobacter sp. P1(2025) TaxID=3446120 RepID=UPI003F53DD73
MHIKIEKEKLLSGLNFVMGAVERRHTLAILANVKVTVADDQLILVGSDLEVQLVAKIPLNGEVLATGETTIPARKLLDICKALPNDALVDLKCDEKEHRCVIKSGKSRFSLGTFSAQDYPLLTSSTAPQVATVDAHALKRLFTLTSPSMAVQDVRFYLTGTLIELSENNLSVVATDGHRLSLGKTEIQYSGDQTQSIVPRKGVSELQRLLALADSKIDLLLGADLLNVNVNIPLSKANAETITVEFTTKLIDGKFPDYRRVIPRNNLSVILNPDDLKSSLIRVATVSNEKLRGIRLVFTQGSLQLRSNNTENDEAVEDLAVEYSGKDVEVAINVQYLLDVLSVFGGASLEMLLGEGNAAILIVEPNNDNESYVVMPMRL